MSVCIERSLINSSKVCPPILGAFDLACENGVGTIASTISPQVIGIVAVTGLFVCWKVCYYTALSVNGCRAHKKNPKYFQLVINAELEIKKTSWINVVHKVNRVISEGILIVAAIYLGLVAYRVFSFLNSSLCNGIGGEDTCESTIDSIVAAIL